MGIYDFNKETGTIRFYRGEDQKVIEIPSEIDGVEVKKIAPLAFAYCKNLEKVIFPNSNIKFAVSSFEYCDKLNDIEMR